MIHDPNIGDPSRSEILAFQPEILAGAFKMSGDENEAHQLAHLTFVKALEAPRSGVDLKLWLFGILRGVFHSVERQRLSRRERGFTVAIQRTALTEQAI